MSFESSDSKSIRSVNSITGKTVQNTELQAIVRQKRALQTGVPVRLSYFGKTIDVSEAMCFSSAVSISTWEWHRETKMNLCGVYSHRAN